MVVSDAPTTALGGSTARTAAGGCTGVVWLGVAAFTLGTCTGEAGVTPSFCRPAGTGLRVILANAGTALLVAVAAAAGVALGVLFRLSLLRVLR